MRKYDLIKATLADKPVLENMWYYYVYDLTRYCGFIKGWETPIELSFKSDDLTKYFTDPDSHLFLINIGNEHAGFVLVKKLEVMPKVDWFMSEFFIVSKFQRSGIGQAVAKEIFEKFSGEWAVGVLPEHVGALNFWRKVIIEYTSGNFYEVEKTSEQLKTAEHPDPYPMIVMRFKTPKDNINRQVTHTAILREPRHIEQRDPRLVKIVNHLKEKYDCHTIILYGSRARGDETLASDYDIIAIRDKGEMERDCRKFEGVFLDIFIYSLEEIKQPSDFLRIKDGIVICEKDRIGSELLEEVRNCYKKGPIPKPAWEKQVIVSWGQKMLERANLGDIEGNFRAHWLIYDLLDGYFQLRDLWYLGPKEAFQWLKENDAVTYTLFENVLRQGLNLKHLKELTEKVDLVALPNASYNVSPNVQILDPSLAEKVCRALTAELPEWFGIPEANERYAKGCSERTSFAAMLDNNYIGMITLEFPFENNANIYWMAVNKKYQGQNIGSQLLKAAEKYCVEQGFKTITVETLSPKQKDPHYLQSYRFYEKNEFKPLFELNPYGPELLMCYMVKPI